MTLKNEKETYLRSRDDEWVSTQKDNVNWLS